jgi:uncharacterized protein YggU (UPF0235/DUF167 family)
VRVTPKGGRDAIDGVWLDTDGQAWLGVRVSVPPADGAANAAVTMLLAKQFGHKKSDITLVSGASARLKRFKLTGSPERLAKMVSDCIGGA